jgi:hypothetical protein
MFDYTNVVQLHQKLHACGDMTQANTFPTRFIAIHNNSDNCRTFHGLDYSYHGQWHAFFSFPVITLAVRCTDNNDKKGNKTGNARIT